MSVQLSETTRSGPYAKRWWALGALCLNLVVIGMDNTVLNVALPTLSKDLHPSASQLEWMVDSYTLVFAGLLLTMGALGDRFGRKRALNAGLLIFGIGSVASAFAPSAGVLIATRALMGTGGAIIMPATIAHGFRFRPAVTDGTNTAGHSRPFARCTVVRSTASST